MRKKSICLVLLFLSFSVACTTPPSRSTFNRYRRQGFAAEARGDLSTAEIAFYRAVKNVRWGNLGQYLESEALFDLGRVKRLVGKLDESEELLKKALTLEEKRYGKGGFLTSFTIAELALTLYEVKRYKEGVSLMVHLEPIVLQYKQHYTDQAKQFIKKTYKKYGKELLKQGKLKQAEKFKKVSNSF